MKKVLVIIGMFIFSGLCGASALPEIPEDCFDDENYCFDYKVATNTEVDKRVIRVDFIAELDAGDYEDEQEILDRFLDFDSWGDYTVWLADFGGSEKKALKVAPMVIDYCTNSGTKMFEGREVIINNASYWNKVPFPVNRLKVVERALYFPIETIDGALFTWKFVADPSFTEGEGIQYKTGTLSISYDEDEEVYYAFATIDVIPDMGFELALNFGAKSVATSLVSIFSGMFGQ